jgi:hypothetical protein
MRTTTLGVTLFLVASAAYGQFGDSRRATITGAGGDRGKCTIEVEVDDTAEVEVSGTQGRIRNFSGQRASWRRFECTGPLPRNPADFRFRGIDGRGQVNLVTDPRQSRGAAIVRIYDPKGGREGYTFDLEWSGGNSGGGGNWNGGGGGGNGGGWGGGNGGGWGGNNGGRPPFGNQNGRLITCESRGNRRTYCDVDRLRGVRLVRERGNNCREGSTWGYDRRGIWVERGCSAQFEVR